MNYRRPILSETITIAKTAGVVTKVEDDHHIDVQFGNADPVTYDWVGGSIGWWPSTTVKRVLEAANGAMEGPFTVDEIMSKIDQRR